MHGMRANGGDVEAHQKMPCISHAPHATHPKNRNMSNCADNMAFGHL